MGLIKRLDINNNIALHRGSQIDLRPSGGQPHARNAQQRRRPGVSRFALLCRPIIGKWGVLQVGGGAEGESCGNGRAQREKGTGKTKGPGGLKASQGEAWGLSS